MKKIRLLFQGDSITDCGRLRNDPHHLGGGYPEKAAAALQQKYPEVAFEFLNLGCGGDQTKDLVDRLETDFIDIQPDVVSIMIGINDVWHHAADRDWIDNALFEERYRTVLKAVKERTAAKIMIMEPYLMPVEDKLYFREDLSPKIEVIRKLAREYADVYVPTDGLLCSAGIGKGPAALASDGVHPTNEGADILAGIYCEYVSKIVDQLIAD